MWAAWDKTKEWHVTEIVTFNGCDYFALKEVPIGIDITNTTYWMLVQANGTKVNHEDFQMQLIKQKSGGGDIAALEARVSRLEQAVTAIRSDILNIQNALSGYDTQFQTIINELNTLAARVSTAENDAQAAQTAATSAEAAAQAAQSTASGAAADAQSAVTTAQAAQTTASGAAADAQSAVTTAQAAQSTASGAAADAQSAVTAAQAAQSTASGKQDKLTPGNNIQIDANNVISATGTTSTAWSDITGKPSDLVQDPNYVHTDNNFTTTEKNKLESLNNYDDTELSNRVTTNETNIVDMETWVYNNLDIASNTYINQYANNV